MRPLPRLVEGPLRGRTDRWEGRVVEEHRQVGPVAQGCEIGVAADHGRLPEVGIATLAWKDQGIRREPGRAPRSDLRSSHRSGPPPSACRATTRSISVASIGAALRPASRTSSCVIGVPSTPAAALETRRERQHLHAACRATIASGTVDIPTTSAPSVRQHPDLRGGLVARAGQAGVDALGRSMPSRRGLLAGDRPQTGRVHLGHVGESRAEPVVVETPERIGRRAD